MSKHPVTILIEGAVVHETEMAYLFDHGGSEPVWLGKSLCEWDRDEKTMEMPTWLATEKGLV